MGVRMHSGWGVLVAVSNDGGHVKVIARERIEVINEKNGGKKQPYHFARTMAFGAAERYLARSAGESQRLAREVILALTEKLQLSGYRVGNCAVLTASGRELPPLAEILAAHPLIHTAEGEFFREAIARACGALEISVSRVRERDVEQQATTAFGKLAPRFTKQIADAGKALGTPWTQEHKRAALAAWIALA